MLCLALLGFLCCWCPTLRSVFTCHCAVDLSVVLHCLLKRADWLIEMSGVNEGVFFHHTSLWEQLLVALITFHGEKSVRYSCNYIHKHMLSLCAKPFPFGNHAFPSSSGLVGEVELRSNWSLDPWLNPVCCFYSSAP